MIILALDLAGKTGYAVLDFKSKKEKLLDKGVIKVNPKDDYRSRFLHLNYELKQLIHKVEPDLIVIEELHSTRNAKTTMLLGMYLGVVFITIPKEIPIHTVNVISARQKVLKSLGRRVTKEDVFEWVTKRHSLKEFSFKKDNDITDAIFIAYHAYHQLTDCS